MIDGNAKMEDLLKTVYEWNYLKPEKKSDFEEEMKEASDDFESGIALVQAFYDEMTYTCRVTDTETMSKSEMQEFLDDNGISENCTTDKITEMCNCTVVTTVTYGDEKSESETEMVCIKADGKWYLSFSALDM